MLKKIATLSLTAFLATNSTCLAQDEADTTTTEPIPSEARIKQAEIENKGKIVSEINKQIYNKANDPLMREYIRNSNAFKRRMDQPTKEVNIQDKKALSQYMQDDIGLQKEIIKVKLPDEKEKSARPTAADLLK